MKRFALISAAIATTLLATACGKDTATSGGAPAALAQEKVCEVRGWTADVTSECQPGQKIAFLPNQWGNEQLPLLFAAVNCDMRYTDAMNNGGVVCIHARMQAAKAEQGAPAPAAKK